MLLLLSQVKGQHEKARVWRDDMARQMWQNYKGLALALCAQEQVNLGQTFEWTWQVSETV